MTKLRRQLSIKDGIALGVGSIMGSGILFLPSMTYATSGSSAIAAWIVTTLLCLPLLVVFREMVKAVPSERGIEGWIELGLGRNVAAAVPLLLLGTVCIGMPSAALIAARYVGRYLELGPLGISTIALCLVALACGANGLGVKTGSCFQAGVAFALFFISLLLLVLTTPQAVEHAPRLELSLDPSLLAKGIVLAFWAYAGFENMTFMAGEFKNPGRDIVVSIAVSLALCAFLYVGLTVNYVLLVPVAEIDRVAGLYQLASQLSPQSLATLTIAAFAVGAVLINLVSWTWGISRLVYSSANQGSLPRWFGALSARDVPGRAIGGLFAVFCAAIALFSVFPDALDAGLTVVSSNFVVVYFLCLLAYVRRADSWAKRVFGVVLLAAVAIPLASSKWLLLYPAAILAVAALIARKRGEPHAE